GPPLRQSPKPVLRRGFTGARRRHPLQRRRENQCRGILRLRGLGAPCRRQDGRPPRQLDDGEVQGDRRALFEGWGVAVLRRERIGGLDARGGDENGAFARLTASVFAGGTALAELAAFVARAA